MKLALYVESTRPKIFVASIAPVAVGTALAYSDGTVVWYLVPFTVVCAMLIQLLSNWVNDLYDFRRGADVNRVGPRRMLAQGLISYTAHRKATWYVAALCLVVGLPLIVHGGWVVFLIGAVCMTAAWAYTGGPFPLAYHGLGDLAALLFFGITAISGTYFIHTATVTADVLIISAGPGLLVANILAVNNIRDIDNDGAIGKRTLAVVMGIRLSRVVYVLATAGALVAPLLLLPTRGWTMFVPLISLPLAVRQCYLVGTQQGAQLNRALAGAAGMYLLYAVAVVIALVV